jgi:hypothetical protein
MNTHRDTLSTACLMDSCKSCLQAEPPQDMTAKKTLACNHGEASLGSLVLDKVRLRRLRELGQGTARSGTVQRRPHKGLLTH